MKKMEEIGVDGAQVEVHAREKLSKMEQKLRKRLRVIQM